MKARAGRADEVSGGASAYRDREAWCRRPKKTRPTKAGRRGVVHVHLHFLQVNFAMLALTSRVKLIFGLKLSSRF